LSEFIMAEANERVLPKRDVIFGISALANEMAAREGKDKVIDGTIGSLLDDEGKLMILSSVVDVLRSLSPEEFAEYAPIGGIPAYLDAVVKEVFGDYRPKGFTRAVATPGGTGSIRNTIVNYSKPGDKILTSDWFWGPYNTIAQEHGRTIATYTLFDEDGKFNIASFEDKVMELCVAQDKIVVIINTPAHNPTGYSISDADWDQIIGVFNKATSQGYKVTLFIDAAYLDYAGDPKEVRSFLAKLDCLNDHILVIIGYSMSKGYTLYGMRSGAMICLTQNEEIADEFKKICEQSCRGTWSNCTRAAQELLIKVHNDPALMKKVQDERASFRDMLLERGRAFEQAAKECGLPMVPFDGGFFTSVPTDKPEALVDELMKEGLFLVPLVKGVRIAVSALPLEKVKIIPAKIKAAMERI